MYASPAHTQYVVSARAGTIHFTEGEVYLDAQPVRATPMNFPLMADGQVLRTGNGRAEVLLAPGAFLRLDSQAAIKMLNGQLEDTQVELQKGTALIEVVQLPKDARLQIKLGETATSFKGMGLHRFDADARELRVFGGTAEVIANDRKLGAGRGRMVRLGSVPSLAKFNTKETDALHDWSARRSFLLYTSSSEALAQRITNWESTASGWSWNRDFDVRLFSPRAAAEYRAREAREAADRKLEQQTQDMLLRQEQLQQQAQQQQAQQQSQQQQSQQQQQPQQGKKP